MSDIFDIFAEQVPQLVSEHWGLFLVAVGLSLAGEFFKRFVWTKERATKHKVWLWARRTMPFHPMVIGLVADLFLGRLYYVAAGVLSIWLFSVVRQWVKSHYQIELSLWNETQTNGSGKVLLPPPMPPDGRP